MHRVVLREIEPARALELKAQLVRDGLIMHVDFKWEYHPPVWDGFSQEQAKHVVFSFTDPALATFYQLKWM
jgi:hypothetical protein